MQTAQISELLPAPLCVRYATCLVEPEIGIYWILVTEPTSRGGFDSWKDTISGITCQKIAGFG